MVHKSFNLLSTKRCSLQNICKILTVLNCQLRPLSRGCIFVCIGCTKKRLFSLYFYYFLVIFTSHLFTVLFSSETDNPHSVIKEIETIKCFNQPDYKTFRWDRGCPDNIARSYREENSLSLPSFNSRISREGQIYIKVHVN